MRSPPARRRSSRSSPARSRGDPLVLSIDLARPAEVERMAAETIAHFGRVDVLMANAGVYVPGEVAEGDPDAWENMIAVNVNSVFRSVRAVLPEMIARRSGDIIVTSSIAGHKALRGEPVYSATKHAVQILRSWRPPPSRAAQYPHRRDRTRHRPQRIVGRNRSC